MPVKFSFAPAIRMNLHLLFMHVHRVIHSCILPLHLAFCFSSGNHAPAAQFPRVIIRIRPCADDDDDDGDTTTTLLTHTHTFCFIFFYCIFLLQRIVDIFIDKQRQTVERMGMKEMKSFSKLKKKKKILLFVSVCVYLYMPWKPLLASNAIHNKTTTPPKNKTKVQLCCRSGISFHRTLVIKSRLPPATKFIYPG